MGDFVLVFHDGASGSAGLWDRLRDRALGAGMTVKAFGPTGWLAVGGVHPPRVTVVGAWTLIGDVINRSRPELVSGADDPLDYERKMMRRFWGRFVGVKCAASGRPAAVMRDPSGALEAVTWKQDGLIVIASGAALWLLDTLRPDWSRARRASGSRHG
jgi:asparagine synthase (glutamine-hydrolysing)